MAKNYTPEEVAAAEIVKTSVAGNIPYGATDLGRTQLAIDLGLGSVSSSTERYELLVRAKQQARINAYQDSLVGPQLTEMDASFNNLIGSNNGIARTNQATIDKLNAENQQRQNNLTRLQEIKEQERITDREVAILNAQINGNRLQQESAQNDLNKANKEYTDTQEAIKSRIRKEKDAEEYYENLKAKMGPITNNYGFTDEEWASKSDMYKRGVRQWAHDQAIASKMYLNEEVNAWTKYISDGNTDLVDTVFGQHYKYKAFFQSVQDARNAQYFQMAEGEINAITGARGFINPAPATSLNDMEKRFVERASNSYSGCDIIPSITVGGKTFVIGNLSGISYSVHRDKVPVRTLGRTYAKSYVSGGATIAGTLIFTVFDTHVLDEVRREVVTEVQAAGGQSSPLTQQLPPFDVTIFFQNEYGHASYMRIYGIEVTDEAQTHTINDIYTENQMQYIARDIDLMCRVEDNMFTPQALAGGNTTIFTQYNLATPAYRLQHKNDNDKQIGVLQTDTARIGNEINNLTTKIAELEKTTPQTAEIINTTKRYNVQLEALQNQLVGKSDAIKNLQLANEQLISSQSEVDDESVNLGSNFSARRDDPYALSRGRPLTAR